MQNFDGFKKKFAMPAAVAAVLAAILVAAAFAAPFLASSFRLSHSVTVVIDAGHGGIDNGVTGVKTGVKESELNLAVAKILGEYLEGAGFNVVYTRLNEEGLYSAFDSNKKRADMEKRVEIIRRAAPAAVVSIHMNEYTSPSRRGAQAFFDGGSQEGRVLAQIVQEFLNDDFNVPDTGREYEALKAEKYILQNSASPAVIVECGFLSNPLDEANLTNAEYRAEIAYTIFRAVAVYLSASGSSGRA